MRVQWCTVSVVDPIATVPFLLLLVVASRYKKDHRLRAVWNWVGVAWFCGYLGYTVWHKSTVVDAFKSALQTKNIPYQRLYTNPTIFNNIVWSGVAEGDTAFYFGQYGFNDARPGVQRISTIPKNHHLLQHIPLDDRAYRFLRWFSDGYYNVLPYSGDTLQVNDLRFGLMGDTLLGKNYVFPFLLFKNARGEWDVAANNRSEENMRESKRTFGDLWKRVKGEPHN
jgi:inner membrane protein